MNDKQSHNLALEKTSVSVSAWHDVDYGIARHKKDKMTQKVQIRKVRCR